MIRYRCVGGELEKGVGQRERAGKKRRKKDDAWLEVGLLESESEGVKASTMVLWGWNEERYEISRNI